MRQRWLPVRQRLLVWERLQLCELCCQVHAEQRGGRGRGRGQGGVRQRWLPVRQRLLVRERLQLCELRCQVH